MRFTLSSLSFKKLAGTAAALMILPIAVGCGPEAVDEALEPDASVETEEVAMGETIVDVAAGNGSFNTLVAAIQAADLAETLSAEGPYTVFAPTDDAFAALPDGLLDTLLLEENKGVLEDILTYHVVAGEVPSSAVETGMVPSLEGTELSVMAEDGSVTVDGANVTMPDVAASNGIIHVIDAVLIPEGVDPAAL